MKMDLEAVEIREKLFDGVCPFCGAGPFSVVAGHVVRKHEINSRELHNMAGLFYRTSITSPEYHEATVERSRRTYRENHAERYLVYEGGEKELSDAGVKSQKERAAKITPAMRRRVGRLNSERRLAAAADRDAAGC